MADLSEELKLEIVTRLARFEAPSDIAHDLQSREVDTGPVQIGRYDPTRSYYAGGDKWRPVFEAARKAYLEDVSAVPVANQGYRLNLLQHCIEQALKKRNYVLAAQLSKQAAEEVGGVLTNQRHLNVDDARKQRARDMTSDERKDALAEIVRQAMESMPAPPGVEPQHPTQQ